MSNRRGLASAFVIRRFLESALARIRAKAAMKRYNREVVPLALREVSKSRPGKNKSAKSLIATLMIAPSRTFSIISTWPKRFAEGSNWRDPHRPSRKTRRSLVCKNGSSSKMAGRLGWLDAALADLEGIVRSSHRNPRPTRPWSRRESFQKPETSPSSLASAAASGNGTTRTSESESSSAIASLINSVRPTSRSAP